MVAMLTNSHPRIALVTGGGGGLGRAFCLRLAREDWHVVVTDIDYDAAQQSLRILKEVGGNGQAEPLDVTDAGDWQRLREKLRQSWPRLDLLINNAGICAAADMGTAPIEDFQRVLAVNLHGVFHGCYTMVPWMRETAKETAKETGKETPPRGHIVNVASIFGVVSPPAMTTYCASKAAVIALSESLYGELRAEGVGVTVVAPEFFATDLVSQGRFPDETQRVIADSYMERSLLTAEEVVSQTLAAVERQKLYLFPGPKARWYWRFKRLFPTTITKIAAYRQRKQMQKHIAGD